MNYHIISENRWGSTSLRFNFYGIARFIFSLSREIAFFLVLSFLHLAANLANGFLVNSQNRIQRLRIILKEVIQHTMKRVPDNFELNICVWNWIKWPKITGWSHPTSGLSRINYCIPVKVSPIIWHAAIHLISTFFRIIEPRIIDFHGFAGKKINKCEELKQIMLWSFERTLNLRMYRTTQKKVLILRVCKRHDYFKQNCNRKRWSTFVSVNDAKFCNRIVTEL